MGYSLLLMFRKKANTAFKATGHRKVMQNDLWTGAVIRYSGAVTNSGQETFETICNRFLSSVIVDFRHVIYFIFDVWYTWFLTCDILDSWLRVSIVIFYLVDCNLSDYLIYFEWYIKRDILWMIYCELYIRRIY